LQAQKERAEAALAAQMKIDEKAAAQKQQQLALAAKKKDEEAAGVVRKSFSCRFACLALNSM